jgi:hypothetical protein
LCADWGLLGEGLLGEQRFCIVWELLEHRANRQWKAHPDVAMEQRMQKLLNSRGQEQKGQIGTEELSQNVAGLGPSNRKGRGKWQGRGAKIHGDSAAVRRFCGAVGE